MSIQLRMVRDPQGASDKTEPLHVHELAEQIQTLTDLPEVHPSLRFENIPRAEPLHSGLVAVSIPVKDEAEAQDALEKAQAIPCTELAWKGNPHAVHILAKVDPVPKGLSQHVEAFDRVAMIYSHIGVTDKAGSDINVRLQPRHDANRFYNPASRGIKWGNKPIASGNYVNDPPPELQLPDTLFVNLFAEYANLFQGRTEVAPEYHFACVYSLVGAICGRRYYLDELNPIYPNSYIALVGRSSMARKSSALTLANDMLKQSDPAVFKLNALSTPEGLINMFVPDQEIPAEEGGKPTEVVGGISSMHGHRGDESHMESDIREGYACDREGFRIFLTLDEIAAMLRKAGKQSSSGLLETLTQFFNFPEEQQLPTRGTPLSAPYPCLTILGATTYEWFEGAFREENIHGGVANRFLYFYNPPTSARHFITHAPDRIAKARVAKQLAELRQKFGEPSEPSEQVPFQWTQEAVDAGSTWYHDYYEQVEAEENVFIAQALARADLYLKKSALIHAILTNSPGDTQIHPESVEWAIGVQEYLIETTRAIYDEFNTNHQKRVEAGILKLLKSSGEPMTARQIWRDKSIRNVASNKDIRDTMLILVQVQQVEIHEGSHTNRYSIAAEE